MNGPESWKSKCAIRRADDVEMTADGTLIMRRQSSAPPPRDFGETAQFNAPSLAPFAIDVRDFGFRDEEDHFPPARNSDVLGVLRLTSEVDPGGSTTRASFFAGMSAGFSVLAVAAAFAFVSFTSDYGAPAAGRSPRVAERGHASLTVVGPDVAVSKDVPKPARHRVRRAAPRPAEDAPEPVESQASEVPETD